MSQPQTTAQIVTDSQSLELARQAETILEGNRTIAIITDLDYQRAGETLKEIKGRSKALEDRRVYLKAPSLETGRRIDEFFQGPIRFLKEAEAAIKKAMLSYTKVIERRRAEAEFEASAAAHDERKRIAKEAEELKARASLQIASILDQAEQASINGDNRAASRLMAKAEQLEETAEVQAAMHADRAGDVVPVAVTIGTPRVSGQSRVEVWKFRVTDEALVPREYLVVNEKLLGQIARTTCGRKKIPGVEFYMEESLRSTT